MLTLREEAIAERIAVRVVELLGRAPLPSSEPSDVEEVDEESIREDVRQMLDSMRRNRRIRDLLLAARRCAGIDGDSLLTPRMAANRAGYSSMREFAVAVLAQLKVAGTEEGTGGKPVQLWWRSDIDGVVAEKGYGPRGDPRRRSKRSMS